MSWQITYSRSEVSASRGAFHGVRTASTPGCDSASEVSIEVTEPRAMVEVTGWRNTGSPGPVCSKAYCAVPVTFAGPSSRGVEVPMALIADPPLR